MESLSVWYHDERIGALSVRTEGCSCVLEFFTRHPLDGLQKLWLCGTSEPLLLGTLCPEGGGFSLRRRLSLRAMEGYCSAPGGRGVLLPPGYAPAADTPQPGGNAPLESLISDRELLAELSHAAPAIVQAGTRLTLTWRWQVGAAFPAPALFCFTRWQRETGTLTLTLDHGRPVL